MPIGLAIFSGGLKEAGIDHQVLDLFGLSPTSCTQIEDRWIFGENFDSANNKLSMDPSLIVVYANQAANHYELISIISNCKRILPKVPIYILENSQAVTAYSLKSVMNYFEEYNIAGIICGTPDQQVNSFISKTLKIDMNLLIPSANWDQFPLENYWRYKLSHGPQTTSRYLPVLTSYGCPWACTFCVVPAMNNRRWAGRQTHLVYQEIFDLKEKYAVNEFHIEDLNSSVNEDRLLDFADKIQSLSIKWKVVAGTKAETLSSFETLKKLKDSGLTYFSFSPESGSGRVKQSIGKRFENTHSFKLIRWSKKLKVKTQACFILGMPNERILDRFRTLCLIRIYSILGIDEIAVFIISPMPGASIYSDFKVDIQNISFSPTWRQDYKKLSLIRLYWYFNFLVLKTFFHPISILLSVHRFITTDFELKMELAPFRSLQWKRWAKNKFK